MIKIVFAWRDRRDRSPEECERHYRAVHMPLARKAFDGVPGFVALRYNRVRRFEVNDYNTRPPRAAEPDFHAWVELYFENEDLLAEAFSRPELGALFDDHVNFMETDTPANIHVFHVDEEVILAAPGHD